MSSFKEEWEIWDEDPLDRIKIKKKKERKPSARKDIENISYGIITSQSYQVETIREINDIWKRGYVSVCTALTGAGKTYISSLAARLWDADHVFVVGPTLSMYTFFLKKIVTLYVSTQSI